MPYIECTQTGFVTVITINREKAMNALNDEVIVELGAAVDSIDTSVTRCVIITGAGEKAFVAGADIGEMAHRKRCDVERFTVPGSKVLRKVELLPAPTIAAINGYALGGGCELALCCDIRIAAENAVIGLPEVTLGIIPGYGGTQRLPRAIGLSKAKELIYTAKRVKAAEALRIGLVSQVVPQKELMDTCMELANRIAASAPIAVRAAKRAIDEGLQTDIEAGLCIEMREECTCFETEDQQNAMSAFVEKRKPDPFVNR